MEIEVTKRDIEQVEFYVENYLVDSMNKACLSFPAMSFILQTLLNETNKVKKELEE